MSILEDYRENFTWLDSLREANPRRSPCGIAAAKGITPSLPPRGGGLGWGDAFCLTKFQEIER